MAATPARGGLIAALEAALGAAQEWALELDRKTARIGSLEAQLADQSAEAERRRAEGATERLQILLAQRELELTELRRGRDQAREASAAALSELRARLAAIKASVEARRYDELPKPVGEAIALAGRELQLPPRRPAQPPAGEGGGVEGAVARARRAQREVARLTRELAERDRRLEAAAEELESRARRCARLERERDRSERERALPEELAGERGGRAAEVGEGGGASFATPRVRTGRGGTTRLEAFVRRGAIAVALLDRYVEEFPRQLAALRAGLDGGDRAGLEEIAVSLTERFHEIGAQRLSDLAAHVELAISGGERPVVVTLLDTLQAELSAQGAWLAELRRRASR